MITSPQPDPSTLKTTALFLQAQARLGLGEMPAAKTLLSIVLQRDPNHAQVADLSQTFNNSQAP